MQLMNLRYLIVCCSLAACSATAFAETAPQATQPLDDPVERLVPRQTRNEQDDDRLAAAAHFAAGRMLQQRDLSAEALRHYERALRYDGEAAPVLRELVPLAFSLNRAEEGLRYMVKFIDESTVDESALIKAGEFLAESGEWGDAIKVYERLAKQLAKEKDPAQLLAVQLELGRLYFLTEQYPESANAFKRVLDGLENGKGLDEKVRTALVGEKGQTYELLGATFIEANRADDARAAFDRLRAIDPDAKSNLLNLARVSLVAGKPQEAVDELEKYFESGASPTSVISYEVLEKALKQLGKEKETLPKLEAILAKQPDNMRLKYFLGRAYLDAGDTQKAQPLLEAALADKPAGQVYRALAKLYQQTNQPEALLKLLAQVVDKSGSLSALEADAKAIVADEKLLDQLFEVARKNHGDAKPEDFSALKVAALLAGETKRWNDAEKFFNLALKAKPSSNSELLLVWGVSLLLDNKAAEAAVVLQRGIDERAVPDDNGSLYYYLAGALEMLDKTDEALLAANSAAERQTKSADMVCRPAWILYHAKRYDDAEKAYEAVLEKLADDFETDGAREAVKQARSALSNINVIKGNVPKGVEYLEQLLDEYPDDVGATNDLGYLWADSNQHLNRALQMTQTAVAAEPDNYAYRDSLGWAQYRLGRYAEAVTQLEKAIDKDDPDGEVLEHLGEVQLKLGRNAEAKAIFNKALDAFKKSGDAEKMKIVEKRVNALNQPDAPKK
jgi:tetratricopeptide (TPR) repeat protein